MNDESIWKAVHRMDAAADVASRAADRMEEAARRIALLLEDGYGGNGPRLIEALEKLPSEQPNAPAHEPPEAVACSGLLDGTATTKEKE